MKILAWVVAAVVFWIAVEAHAGDADPRRIVAELLTDLHYDGPPPEITWVNPREVVEVCGCAPKALYRENNAYLSRALNLDNVEDRAVLLHELVHHIQWVAGGPAKDCSEWKRREILAHAAQNAWLIEHGSGRRAMFTGSCQ